MSVFDELKRRKVFKVAAAYVIVGWLIMQVGEVMAPALHLPEWVISALAFFLILGFPVAIVLSWAFELTPEGIKLDSKPKDESTDSRAGDPRFNYWIIGLLVVALGFFAFDKFVLEGARDTRPPQLADNPALSGEQKSDISIAVLAFEDMSPEQDQRYLSDGLAEEVLNALAKLPGLRVISRSSSFTYRGKDIRMSQIAGELGVGHILEGSVRKSGDRVRITAQLIDARSDSQLWSETYDRTLDDIFAVQEDVARSVAASLLATFTPEANQKISQRPTDNLAAYDLYLRGHEAYHQGDVERPESLDLINEAIEKFEEAIDLDPDFALAWAGLADAYSALDGRFGFPHDSKTPTAIEHAKKALAIDPELAEAHRALGYAYDIQGKLEDALKAYRAAVALSPNNYDAWVGLSRIHEASGRYDEGVFAAERANRLAPREISPLFYLAHNYKYLSFDEAVLEAARKTLAIDPKNVGARLFEPQLAVYAGDTDEAMRLAHQIVEDLPDKAYALVGASSMAYMAKEYGLAIEWARRAWELEPNNVLGYWHHNEVLLGLSLWNSGEKDEAEEILNTVIESYTRRIEEGQRDWGLEWDLASIYATRAEDGKAMDWFERAYGAGFLFSRWPPVDPAFDALRNNPRYRKVMSRMEAEVGAMRARVLEANPSLR